MSQGLRSQALWLLVIVHLARQVDGITRLQKIAFLTNELVPNMNRVGFYDDWKAGKYGPYSPSLSDDVEVLVAYGLLERGEIESSAGYTLDSYKVTARGEEQARGLEQSHSKLVETIKKTIVDKYAQAPLMSILHDTYYLAPQYTTESEIAGNIFNYPKRGPIP